MKATLGQALQAYASAATKLQGTPPPAKGGASFGELLQGELRGVVADLRQGEQASVAGLMGKASVQQVVEAVSTAELSLQKVTAVRDRVIGAYQEIVRMAI